jgi:arsenical pump membrane protein
LLSVLILHGILAGVAVAAAATPGRALAIAAGAAAVDVVLGADIAPALATAVPMAAFLGGAMSLAGLVERSGLCERGAAILARCASGRSWALYALVCATCAGLTAVLSLDGAVVLMVPLVLALARRFDAPFAPLFTGVVAVANPASIAVPQGNPTNLVVMARLGLSPAAFTAHLALPALAAAAVGAAGVAVTERRSLSGRHRMPVPDRGPLPAAERYAAATLMVGAVVACVCPLAGVEPWWPFAGVAAVAVAGERWVSRLAAQSRPASPVVIPWRLGLRVAALVVVVGALPVAPLPGHGPGALALLAVAAGVGTVAAVVNNLPASVWAASLLTAGPIAYAALIGLGVGALATPQGSVATLVAADLAGGARGLVRPRRLVPLAVVAVTAAWAMLAAPL